VCPTSRCRTVSCSVSTTRPSIGLTARRRSCSAVRKDTATGGRCGCRREGSGAGSRQQALCEANTSSQTRRCRGGSGSVLPAVVDGPTRLAERPCRHARDRSRAFSRSCHRIEKAHLHPLGERCEEAGEDVRRGRRPDGRVSRRVSGKTMQRLGIGVPCTRLFVRWSVT
jgi:hypothetical protein